ncbi:hypothetical protein F5Y18DRAFT_112253 [Xylariaceae sp. FL1019]|nr:hypothetical protein F5Y18DRAFT_112253 [Xylariaceae sp. FL1019]
MSQIVFGEPEWLDLERPPSPSPSPPPSVSGGLGHRHHAAPLSHGLQFGYADEPHEILIDGTQRQQYDNARHTPSRFPVASGVRDNPWSDAGKGFPPPPRRQPASTQPQSIEGFVASEPSEQRRDDLRRRYESLLEIQKETQKMIATKINGNTYNEDLEDSGVKGMQALATLKQTTSTYLTLSQKPSRQPPRENRRKLLRVAINGKADTACPDSGSQKNIMAESWAKKHRLKIRREREDRRIFELGNGSRIRSVGRVRARVRLRASGLSAPKEWFYIFANCPVPLILGMPFLERNEILTKNRSLLEDCPPAYSRIDSVFWIGSVRNRLRCSLDSHKAMAVADTGSDVNLMSLAYAKREGYQIDRRQECRRRLQFGDGSQADTVGQVYVHSLTLDWRGLDSGPGPMPTPLVDASITPHCYNQDEDGEPSPTQLSVIFFVLPGLPCDIILGRGLLEATDAFNLCPDLKASEDTRRDLMTELNIIIDRGRIAEFLRSFRKKPDSAAAVQSDVERHDSERHAHWYRISQIEEEIDRSTGLVLQQKRAAKERMLREWETVHVNCQFCLKV